MKMDIKIVILLQLVVALLATRVTRSNLGSDGAKGLLPHKYINIHDDEIAVSSYNIHVAMSRIDTNFVGEVKSHRSPSRDHVSQLSACAQRMTDSRGLIKNETKRSRC